MLGLALLVLGAFPASSEAAVTCAYASGRPSTLTVNSSTDGTIVGFSVSAGVIGVQSSGGAVTCTGAPTGGPTVANTDSITLTTSTGLGTSAEVFDPLAFVSHPSRFIDHLVKFDLDLGSGGTIELFGSAGADSFLIGQDASGQQHVYTNASSTTIGLGQQLVANGVDRFTIQALGGADTVSGAGKPGTDNPTSRDLTVLAGEGADHITGGTGNDLLYGGSGDDTIEGLAGTDTASYEGSTTNLHLDLRVTGPQSNGADTGTDTLGGIENLAGGSGDDVLIGNDAENRLSGGGGSDVLEGAGGNDILEGFYGNTADPAPASNTASYEHAMSGVSVNLGVTGLQNTGGAGIDTLKHIQNITGGAFADHLIGDSGPNSLVGGGGDDNIEGKAGADSLAARDRGHDTVSCGTDADADSVLADDPGVDTIQSDCVSPDTVAFDDTIAPETTIASGPSGTTTDTKPTFTFSAGEAGTTFECALDGNTFAPCTSPATVGPLSDRKHNFAVRATDAHGNTDQTPAGRSFRVDTTGPLVTIPRRRVRVSRRRTAAVQVACGAREPDPCAGRLTLRLRRPGRAPRLGSARFAIRPGHTSVVKVMLSRRQVQLILRLRRPTVLAIAGARDPVGNTSTTSRRLPIGR